MGMTERHDKTYRKGGTMQLMIERAAINWKGIILGIGTLMLLSTVPAWADEKAGYSDKGHDSRMGEKSGMGHGTSHGMSGHGTGHYLRHLLRLQDEIGLTDDQVKKLKAIQLELDKTRIRAEAEISVAEREVAALMDDEKADLGAIEAKLKQSEALQTSLRLAAIKAKREALALLNPDQRKKERIEHEKLMQQHRRGKDGMGSGSQGEQGGQQGQR
jgi:periplasmic protein CpxP/Spy